MNTVNLFDATTNLSSLLDRAAASEEIVIAKSGCPIARLVPLERRTTPRSDGTMRCILEPSQIGWRKFWRKRG